MFRVKFLLPSGKHHPVLLFTVFALCLALFPAHVRAQERPDGRDGSSAQATTLTSFDSFVPITLSSGGAASPYPSTINVGGLAGAVTDIFVTLYNISHTFPRDIDLALVGPGGRRMILMSDACGADVISLSSLRIDDLAVNSMPESANCTLNTYRPTNYDTVDSFPGVAGPFASSFSTFYGTNPNGVWALYAYDDLGGDSGAIAGGWRISIAVTPTFTNLVFNGGFTAGLSGWGTWGVTGGVNASGQLELTRQPGSSDGGFFQFVDFIAPPNSSFVLTLDLSNPSPTPKTLNMIVRNSSWASRSCNIGLAPFSPPQTYIVFLSPSVFYSPIILQGWLTGDTSGPIRIDNIGLSYNPSIPPGPVECYGYPPPNANLLVDGGFDLGTAAWAPFGDAGVVVNSSILYLSRSGAGGDGGIFQFNPYLAGPGGNLQMNFNAGNPSGVYKTVTVVIRGPSWSTAAVCYVGLPAGAPLQPFTMRARVSTQWTNIIVQAFLVQPGAGQFVSLDSLNLQYRPTLTMSAQQECYVGALGDEAGVETASFVEAAALNPLEAGLAFPNPANGVIGDGGIAPLPSEGTAPVAPAEAVKPGE